MTVWGTSYIYLSTVPKSIAYHQHLQRQAKTRLKRNDYNSTSKLELKFKFKYTDSNTSHIYPFTTTYRSCFRPPLDSFPRYVTTMGGDDFAF